MSPPRAPKSVLKVTLDENTNEILRRHARAAGVPMTVWVRAAIFEKAAREDANSDARELDELRARLERVERKLGLES